MICVQCNGKGYLNGKEGDEVCPECLGKGELLPLPDCLDEKAGAPVCPWGLSSLHQADSDRAAYSHGLRGR
jgi:hypothetical protein